jgi:transmembrane sensor
MGLEHKVYTWNLIAKKLAGEASPEELKELELLLRNNPELHYPMQTITDLWNPASPTDQRKAENAFNRHLDRIKDLNLDFDAHGNFGPGIDPGSSADPNAINKRLSPIAIEQDHPYSPPLDESYADSSEDYPFPTNRPRPGRKALLLASVFCLGLAMVTLIAVPRLYRKFRSAAPAVAGATPATGLSTTPNSTRGGDISTRNGSRTHLLLPDSTLVWLNAGSQIKYDKTYGATRREVYLTGEAFFNVARNAEKPFIIHTDRIDIKVLGTSFNIRSYPADKTTEATLIHGSIEVSMRSRPGARVILKPNQKLIVAGEDSTLHRIYTGQPGPASHSGSPMIILKPTYEQNTGTMIETSWIDNKLIFQNEEFGTLAKELERWYGVSIRFTDPGQLQWHFTGTFQKETIGQALDALKMTAGFNYTIEGTQISIFTKE